MTKNNERIESLFCIEVGSGKWITPDECDIKCQRDRCGFEGSCLERKKLQARLGGFHYIPKMLPRTYPEDA